MASRWSPRNWSIRGKSIALALAYVLALGAVYGTFTVSLLRREAARAHDRLHQTAALLAAELDSYVDSGRQRLDLVSRLPGMTYGLRTMQEASAEGRIPPWTTLHYLFFKSPVFTGGALLVDRDDKVLWTEPPGRAWSGKRLNDQPALAQLRRQQDAIVTPAQQPGLLLDQPHVVMVYPIRSPQGEIDGALAGVIDLTAPEFTKILSVVTSNEEGFVQLVDQDGQPLAASGPSQPPTASEGGRWMLATTRLTHAPWTVVVGQPSAVALAQVWQFQRELLVIGIILLTLALLLGVPIINRFLHDVRGLTDAAETMASGDLSRPVPIPGPQDEIATLARAFEQMRLELGQSRTALERRLEEREELIRLKEEFLASISHELRTPLNAIIGYTDMVTEAAQLDTPAESYLHSIRLQSERLYQLLSDLLTLSSLNVGRLAVEVSPVQVAALLGRLRPLALNLCKGKDVTVVVDCPPTLPTLETDPLRLDQILTNLLTNAIKFTDHGTITIEARALSAAEQIQFTVRDPGRGIPASELPYIFDEFRQVDGSSTRIHGGVGLGLALVKRLAELLHGEVSVQSQLGKGSTFTVRLPLRYEPAPMREPVLNF